MSRIKKNIVWLASYPKSGNTWFRVFLSNLLLDSDKPADINELYKTPIASARQIFDEYSGLPSSDLSPDEIDCLRPDVYRQLSREEDETLYLKVHDGFSVLDTGEWMFPPEICKAAVYFIRNPLDVAVSFAHHASISYEKMVSSMNYPGYCFAGKTSSLPNQLRQQLFTWSQHVESWTQQQEIPVHVNRYEDMLARPLETFRDTVHFLGLKKSDKEIQKALAYSDFKELQRQEKENGFREKAPKACSFFRAGKMGTWRESLSEQQVKCLLGQHEKTMQKFGYLDDTLQIIF